MTGVNKRFCRCLLADIPDGAALAKTIGEWIAAMPEEQKVSEKERAARLITCKVCDELRDGTCAQCGCYVEFRAAQRIQRCPKEKW